MNCDSARLYLQLENSVYLSSIHHCLTQIRKVGEMAIAAVEKATKTEVGILGASGYTGAEVMRLISQHPKFNIRMITSNRSVGENINGVYPHLTRMVGHIHLLINAIGSYNFFCHEWTNGKGGREACSGF